MFVKPLCDYTPIPQPEFPLPAPCPGDEVFHRAPRDIMAEYDFIGAIMLQPRQLNHVPDITPDHFVARRNADLWKLLIAFIHSDSSTNSRDSVSMPALKDFLLKAAQPEKTYHDLKSFADQVSPPTIIDPTAPPYTPPDINQLANTLRAYHALRRITAIVEDARLTHPDGQVIQSLRMAMPRTLARIYSSPSQPDTLPKPGEYPWPIPDPAAFHGLAGQLVALTDPHTEADPAATLLQFLTAFGNLIGHGPYFQIGATRHYTNLYTCLIGTSSKSRKGTSLDSALLPLQLATATSDPEWKNRFTSGLSSSESLIQCVHDDILKNGHTVTPDLPDKRLLVLETEFSALIARFRRTGNTLSATLRHAWDHGDLRSVSRGTALQTTNAHISVIAHITAEELRHLLTPNDQTNGFANRFLWAMAKRSKLLPFGGNMDAALLTPITEKLKQIIPFARSTGPMGLTPAAAEFWTDIYEDLSGDYPSAAGAMIARGEAQTRRLACLYALLDHRSVVDVVHLQAAVALWQYCRESLLYAFGHTTTSAQDSARQDRVELLELIRQNDGIITPRQLAHKVHKYRAPGQAEKMLENLTYDKLGTWDYLDPNHSGQSIKTFCLYRDRSMPGNPSPNHQLNLDSDSPPAPASKPNGVSVPSPANQSALHPTTISKLPSHETLLTPPLPQSTPKPLPFGTPIKSIATRSKRPADSSPGLMDTSDFIDSPGQTYIEVPGIPGACFLQTPEFAAQYPPSARKPAPPPKARSP